MIKKLLVANRGEIAVRIIRAAREMGIRTTAVYSDADRDQLHASLADEAVSLGEPESAKSYLDGAKIIAAAEALGADAVHPGYGFLSEDLGFAEACESAGIVFVGPSAASMRLLGSKIQAKTLAKRLGVPLVAGFFEPSASADRLRQAAEEIGFPVMLKASAGGGGRGMRVVREAGQFDDELRIASDEALKAFGDGEMMVEKLIDRPKHIEVQILADRYGTVACLFERDCSLQRRHQKLIEEGPSPAMTPALWEDLQRSARALIETSGYSNAGTVEFMVDPSSGEHYFLEVNARLQVEHPVTEWITGLDLVQWQIRIACGERLGLPPEMLAGDRKTISGHSIEARIVAEDPSADFRPSIGRIVGWAEPKTPGVRVDTGYREGAEVPRYYDSLLAKVIAHGETRAQTISRLACALRDFHILGVKTNVAFLLDVLESKEFAAGMVDTGLLGRAFSPWSNPADRPAQLGAIAAHVKSATHASDGSVRVAGAWDEADSFRVAR